MTTAQPATATSNSPSNAADALKKPLQGQEAATPSFLRTIAAFLAQHRTLGARYKVIVSPLEGETEVAAIVVLIMFGAFALCATIIVTCDAWLPPLSSQRDSPEHPVLYSDIVIFPWTLLGVISQFSGSFGDMLRTAIMWVVTAFTVAVSWIVFSALCALEVYTLLGMFAIVAQPFLCYYWTITLHSFSTALARDHSGLTWIPLPLCYTLDNALLLGLPLYYTSLLPYFTSSSHSPYSPYLQALLALHLLASAFNISLGTILDVKLGGIDISFSMGAVQFEIGRARMERQIRELRLELMEEKMAREMGEAKGKVETGGNGEK